MTCKICVRAAFAVLMITAFLTPLIADAVSCPTPVPAGCLYSGRVCICRIDDPVCMVGEISGQGPNCEKQYYCPPPIEYCGLECGYRCDCCLSPTCSNCSP